MSIYIIVQKTTKKQAKLDMMSTLCRSHVVAAGVAASVLWYGSELCFLRRGGPVKSALWTIILALRWGDNMGWAGIKSLRNNTSLTINPSLFECYR